MTQTSDHQAIVIGAGPAGLATGLALAHCGLKCAVAGPVSDPYDGRTAALFQGSIIFLQNIGAWEFFKDQTEPLKAIRLIDATGGLLRAPEVTFWASEIGHPVFGYNVPTGGLSAALERAAEGRLTRVVTTGVKRIDTSGSRVEIETAEGQTLSAPLVAGADGRGSASRAAAGIETQDMALSAGRGVLHFCPHAGAPGYFHRVAQARRALDRRAHARPGFKLGLGRYP